MLFQGFPIFFFFLRHSPAGLHQRLSLGTWGRGLMGPRAQGGAIGPQGHPGPSRVKDSLKIAFYLLPCWGGLCTPPFAWEPRGPPGTPRGGSQEKNNEVMTVLILFIFFCDFKSIPGAPGPIWEPLGPPGAQKMPKISKHHPNFGTPGSHRGPNTNSTF